MNLYDRIGIDMGKRHGRSVPECIEWAIENNVRYIDVRIDDRLVDGFTDDEIEEIISLSREGDVNVGLHNESAVNMAEISPFVDEAVEKYLFAYVDAAKALDIDWIVVHGGYQFDDYDVRSAAAIDLLQRADERAGDDIDLLLENHNPEPEEGEIGYIPVTLDQCVHFFGELDVGWAFTVNHAHMRPPGIDGFIDELPVDRCREVRLADNRGDVEEHLYPGEGTIDFVSMFNRLEDEGFDGHYMLGFGTLEDMINGRDYLVDLVE